MREKTFCFSGHRNIPDCDFSKIQRRTEEMIRTLIYRGYRYAAVGGALGYDLLALRTLLQLKKNIGNFGSLAYAHSLVIILGGRSPRRQNMSPSSDDLTNWSIPYLPTKQAVRHFGRETGKWWMVQVF